MFPFLFIFIIFGSSDVRTYSISNELGVLPWQHAEEIHEGTCITKECEHAAKSLKHSLNVSVDPCDDFYEFSCGGWIHNHPVPPTESHWNQFDVIDKKLDHQLKEILNESDNPEDPMPVNWARIMYRACMDEERLEELGVKPLAELLDEFGGWPMAATHWAEDSFSWQNAVAAATRRFAVSPLFAVYVYLDRKNSSQSVITVDQTTLVLPRAMLAEPGTYYKILGAYADWIAKSAQEVAKVNKQHVSRSNILVEAHELVEFEIELAQLTSPSEERRDAYRLYNPMSIRQLQKWTDSASSRGDSPIDWHAFLLDLFVDTDVKLSRGEKLIVKEMEYLLKLVALIERTSPRTLANYVMWRLVRFFCRETNQQMRDITFNFEKIYSGVKEDQLRWRECVTRVNNALPFATGYKYVEYHFDDTAKRTAVSMVANIQEAFKSRVDVSNWMDQTTREAASQKADSISQFIGFPDWFQNSSALLHYYHGLIIGKSHFSNVEETTSYQIRRVFNKLREPTDRTEWISGPAVVNAYYNPLTNAIIFPAGILQSPFFSKNRIEALNYGSIGVIIGHEITHGFDDMGRQSDRYGNLAQWWSDETISSYLELAQCFVDEYDAFQVSELHDILGADATVNGITTQGENIADNGGLRQAFHAYERFVQKNGPEPRLPGLKFTPEQLFFLGFSTVWCESATQESLLNEVLSDPHSPHRYRVLGSVSNSPEFAAAWNCPKGSPMNPDTKCRIW